LILASIREGQFLTNSSSLKTLLVKKSASSNEQQLGYWPSLPALYVCKYRIDSCRTAKRGLKISDISIRIEFALSHCSTQRLKSSTLRRRSVIHLVVRLSLSLESIDSWCGMSFRALNNPYQLHRRTLTFR
jgi:hypothetical protein